MTSSTVIVVECARNCFPPYSIGHFGQELTVDDVEKIFIASSRAQMDAWEKECSGCTAQCTIRNLANATPDTVLTIINNHSNILPK